jgi:hypothetical protein
VLVGSFLSHNFRIHIIEMLRDEAEISLRATVCRPQVAKSFGGRCADLLLRAGRLGGRDGILGQFHRSPQKRPQPHHGFRIRPRIKTRGSAILMLSLCQFQPKRSGRNDLWILVIPTIGCWFAVTADRKITKSHGTLQNLQDQGIDRNVLPVLNGITDRKASSSLMKTAIVF